MTLIKVRDLAVGYAGKPVAKGINFSLEEGDFVCVVGANGSGKTTLVKTILGLLKPVTGEVIFENLEPRFVGYLPQEADLDVKFPATVFEVVMSGALNRLGGRAFFKAAEKRLAEEKMRVLKIEKLRNCSFEELSGGQRQRVLLARSLVATSKLLILDEPSNNLDSTTKRELYEILRKLNREGLTVMMITHDLDHDNLLGNRILSLRDEVFYGATEEFVRRIHHE